MHAFVLSLAWNPSQIIKPFEVGRTEYRVSFATGKGLLSAWVGFFSIGLKYILAIIFLWLLICLLISFSALCSLFLQ